MLPEYIQHGTYRLDFIPNHPISNAKQNPRAREPARCIRKTQKGHNRCIPKQPQSSRASQADSLRRQQPAAPNGTRRSHDRQHRTLSAAGAIRLVNSNRKLEGFEKHLLARLNARSAKMTMADLYSRLLMDWVDFSLAKEKGDTTTNDQNADALDEDYEVAERQQKQRLRQLCDQFEAVVFTLEMNEQAIHSFLERLFPEEKRATKPCKTYVIMSGRKPPSNGKWRSRSTRPRCPTASEACSQRISSVRGSKRC